MTDDDIRDGLKAVELIAENRNLIHGNHLLADRIRNLSDNLPQIAKVIGAGQAAKLSVALKAAASHMNGEGRKYADLMNQDEISEICAEAWKTMTPHVRSWDRHTASDFIEDFASAAEAAGYDVRIIGSVSRRGQSDKDLDVLLTVRRADPDPEAVRARMLRDGAVVYTAGGNETDAEQFMLPNGRVVKLFLGKYDPSLMSDEDVGIGLEVVESLARNRFIRYGNKGFQDNVKDLAAVAPFLATKVDGVTLERLSTALKAAQGHFSQNRKDMDLMDPDLIAETCSSVRSQLTAQSPAP